VNTPRFIHIFGLSGGSSSNLAAPSSLIGRKKQTSRTSLANLAFRCSPRSSSSIFGGQDSHVSLNRHQLFYCSFPAKLGNLVTLLLVK
jgi:hypothetical protein